MPISSERLGELLIKNRYLTKEDFELSKKESERKDVPLDILLVEKGLIKDEVLGRIIAEASGYEFIDLKATHLANITPELLSFIPEVVAYAQKAIAFEETENEIKVATSYPENYPFFKLLEKKLGKSVRVFYATPFDIDLALKKYKGDLRRTTFQLIEEIKKDPLKIEINTVKLVNLFLEYAHANLASDVLLEPLEEFTTVRFRIDGVLHKVVEYPKELHDRIVSRIKIMAKLRIDEKSAPQDGSFSFKSLGVTFDVRVSIIPIMGGEKVVIRLLMARAKRFLLSELGLSEADFKKIKRFSEKPYGTILAVGPTGCGKTTTIYAILQVLNRPEVNIMTIEDPIEYVIEGVSQTQVNPAKNITFATGLRSILRQNPDIIMVGEMRDEETVSMCINAAMTGHLVLSTLHANDAATTFPRLLELKAEPFLIASSIDVVIAQRLVRKICDECKKEYFLSQEELIELSEEVELVNIIRRVSGQNELSKIKFYKGEGCRLCNFTGYVGRTGIFEIMEVSENIRSLILKRTSAGEIKKQATKEGMTTMLEDAVNKMLKGITTLAEVRSTIRT